MSINIADMKELPVELETFCENLLPQSFPIQTPRIQNFIHDIIIVMKLLAKFYLVFKTKNFAQFMEQKLSDTFFTVIKKVVKINPENEN